MAYDATRIRPIGRPKIDRASNGLRTITRRYVVTGQSVAAGTVEDEIFLAFGTVDDEYTGLTDQVLGAGYNAGGTYTEDLGTSNTSAYLVAQAIEPSEEVTQAFLTRVYQELESTPVPVQVDQDDVQVSDAGRITVQRKFIVKNTYIDHYDPARIGVDYITVTHDGTARKCYIGGVKSDEHEVFTEFIETFFEDAILSQTIEYRNGLKPDHKLEIRTIRAIAGAEALGEPATGEGPGEGRWYLVSQREGPGSADFGQVGKPVHTKAWAKGNGIVSLQQTHKHDGALEMVSIRSLGEQSTIEDAGIASNGAAFHRVSESMQESSGHQVFSDTYAAGKGRISVSTQSKGLFDVVSETWISEPGGTHASELSNILSTAVSKRDGFDLHAISGISEESGVINVSRQYKHRGTDGVFDLEIVRVTKIGALPTTGDFTAAGNGAAFVMISEGKDDSGKFTIYTATFAAGVGTVQTGVRNTGKITVNSYTSLNTDFPGTAYDQTVSDRDGYVVRTYKTYEKDSSFAGDKTKRWVNKYVYQENTQDVVETIPSPFVTGAAEVSGSYSKQGPSSLWSTTDTDVTVAAPGVISADVRYVPSGNYFHVTKTVASASGSLAATYAPAHSVLVGQATSYERGWVRDRFTWAALSSAEISSSTSTTIPWTLPGVFYIEQGFFISQAPPAKVHLPVVKTTTLSTTPMAVPDVLPVPWIHIKLDFTFKAKTDPLFVDKALYNWVYVENRFTGPWTSLYGKQLLYDHNPTDASQATGWTAFNWNANAAGDYYLAADSSIVFTDGTNTIYRLDTVYGAPTVDPSLAEPPT
jgi:hypothetical protein